MCLRVSFQRSARNIFPEYTVGEDINKAAKYILWHFMQANRARLSIHLLIQAVDMTNSRLGFAAVKKTILQNAWKNSGILWAAFRLGLFVYWSLLSFYFISVYMSMHLIPQYFTHTIILIHPRALCTSSHVPITNLDPSSHALPTIGLLHHRLALSVFLRENCFPIQS